MLCLCLLAVSLKAQVTGSNYAHSRQLMGADSLAFDPRLAPFFHGVASGDPLPESVIIWTRVTTETEGEVEVGWEMALDTAMSQIVQSGTLSTGPERDYTVKVDVGGLSPGQTYYYRFFALGSYSLTGRTKTAPQGHTSHLKFAVISCTNYPQGYFNALGNIARRNDLDAVIHLGDYIYEYEQGRFNNQQLEGERDVLPENETVSLADYRTRYSLYHLDPDLLRAHQQHPFICVWDDHESADNSYRDGARNHQPDTEGDWNVRKRASQQAFYEWVPIREQPDFRIYRTFSFGNLAELLMLDTRLEGRDVQLDDINDPDFLNPDRSILGQVQRNWLLDQLQTTTASWKVIGTQVIFSPFNVGFVSSTDPDSVESQFLDIWDGYPVERDSIINFVRTQAIDDVVFIAGDLHTSFALDINERPTDTTAYQAESGAGAVAVEFVTPSISSPNFDEAVGFLADILEQCVNQPCPFFNSLSNPNPHIKFADLDRHGYFILDLTPDSSQANWYFSHDILQPDTLEEFGAAWYTRRGENHLRAASMPSPPKAVQDIPAPPYPHTTTSLSTAGHEQAFLLLGSYPNPVKDIFFLQYALNRPQQLSIELLDVHGRVIQRMLHQRQQRGIYTQVLHLKNLAEGLYFLRFHNGQHQQTLRLLKR